MSEHIAKQSMVSGCETEASYRIDSEGFVESLLANKCADMFYLWVDHMWQVANEDGLYVHLRLDTAEIVTKEIGCIRILATEASMSELHFAPLIDAATGIAQLALI
jgi:hypothetical protein